MSLQSIMQTVISSFICWFSTCLTLSSVMSLVFSTSGHIVTAAHTLAQINGESKWDILTLSSDPLTLAIRVRSGQLLSWHRLGIASKPAKRLH